MISIPANLSRLAGRAALQAQKHAPTLLIASGVVAGVTSTVMASRATLNLPGVIQDTKDFAEMAKQNHNHDPQAYRKDLTRVYFDGAVRLGRLYGPAAAVGVAGIAMVASGHNISIKRNAALTAAYAVMEKSYSNYRSAVVEKLGEEKERDLYQGVTRNKVKDPETKELVTKVSRSTEKSPYGRFFDETIPNWKPQADLNLFFLKSQERYLNELLRSRGHVFLNEVYDALGMERSGAGAVVGWVIGLEGDNYIDFGIYNEDSEAARAFVNGQESAIFLDFNVDGVIYDKI